MRLSAGQSWPTDVTQARAVQEALRGKVILGDALGAVKTVAGVDVGYERAGAITRAAVVLLDFPSLAPRARAVAQQPTRFPYVPGYLSFREVPAVLSALAQLRRAPDLLLCDGQGIAHPRRFGLACHLGVLTGIPSIGVAKSRLIGTHDPVPEAKGAWVPLYDSPSFPPPAGKRASRGACRMPPQIIGAVLRTRCGVKPLYVSVGHRLSLETAIDYVLRCTTFYRLPQTTRLADRLASGHEIP
jgi:deoxyribonuclease V